MVDNGKEVEGASSCGNEWEVVSLTASAYAAAPGPINPREENKDEERDGIDDETSAAMFMSRHFVFSHSQHEKLPIESKCGVIHNESGGEDSPVGEDGNGTNRKTTEDWKTKSDDSFLGIQFFDKGKHFSMELGDGKALQGLSMVVEKQVFYGAPRFSVLTGDTCEMINDGEPVDPSHQKLATSFDNSNTLKLNEENKCVRFSLPCEAWWKRQAACFYNHAKEANTFWSIFGAAAVIGVVILGQQWQQEKLQLQQLKWQFSISEERMNWMLGPLARFKEVLVGGRQCTPKIHGAMTSSR